MWEDGRWHCLLRRLRGTARKMALRIGPAEALQHHPINYQLSIDCLNVPQAIMAATLNPAASRRACNAPCAHPGAHHNCRKLWSTAADLWLAQLALPPLPPPPPSLTAAHSRALSPACRAAPAVGGSSHQWQRRSHQQRCLQPAGAAACAASPPAAVGCAAGARCRRSAARGAVMGC